MMKHTKQDFNNDEKRLLATAKETLNHESEHLDMSTLMKLENSRKQAIQQSNSEASINNDGSITLNKYLPGTLAALGMLLLLTFFTLQRDSVTESNSLGIFSDLELLSSQESLDFYENMDFYQWLEMNEKN